MTSASHHTLTRLLSTSGFLEGHVISRDAPEIIILCRLELCVYDKIPYIMYIGLNCGMFTSMHVICSICMLRFHTCKLTLVDLLWFTP